MSENNVPCCFLSRTHRYIFECLLNNKERSQALCGHLFAMPQTAHLGANFIASKRENYVHVPYQAQYFTLGDEQKVFVNLNEIFANLMKSIEENQCDFLQDVEPAPGFTLSPIIGPQDCKIEFMSKKHNQASILLIQPLFNADPLGRGFFPHEIHPWTLDFLIDVMSHQQSGHKGVILFMGLNTSISTMHPAAHIDTEYVRLLDEAKKSGVKIASAQVSCDESDKPQLNFNQIFDFHQQSL